MDEGGGWSVGTEKPVHGVDWDVCWNNADWSAALRLSSEDHSRGLKRSRGWRRWLAGLGLLLSLLLVSNLLYGGLAGSAPVLSGAPGELLYAAGFDGFLDEWTLYDGQQRATVTDGALQLTVRDANKGAWTSARHIFADFDLRVEASAIAGPVDNAFGVVFALKSRLQDNCDLPALILCGLEDWSPMLGAGLRLIFEAGDESSYLAFLISSDGYYALMRADDRVQRRISDWIPSSHIRLGLGAENRIRAIGRDGFYTFFINGSEAALCLPDDPAAHSTYFDGDCLEGSMRTGYHAPEARIGQLGLMAQATATGGGGVLTQFDNFVVFQPRAADAGDAKA